MKPIDKIYLTFFEIKEKKLYYNQIKEHSGLSHSSLQNSLKKLVELKVLKYEKRKSNVFYSILDKKLLSLKFSEFALEKFNNLNLGVKSPLKNFLENISHTVFTVVLFGSSAVKDEKKGSDIDILIVSDKKQELSKIKTQIDSISNYPLSIFQCNIDDFIYNKDHVIKQARKKGFPIFKEQNFYEVSLNEY